MTFYDILGVSRHATPDEIRAAYRSLAKQHHPDLFQNREAASRKLAEERTKAINEAYRTLSDPQRRRQYHRIMWTSQDPARKYRHLFTPPPPVEDAQEKQYQERNNAPSAADIFIKIQTLRSNLDFLRHRQQIKRRRFWFGTAFSTLIVFSIMWMENVTLSTTGYSLFTRLLIFIFTFLSCELIAIPIVINTSGMKLPHHPLLSNPVAFSLSIFTGTSLSCVSIIAPRTLNPAAMTSFLSGGIVLSTALLVHLFIAHRLARLQERLFRIEEQRAHEQLEQLEEQWARFREQNKRQR